MPYRRRWSGYRPRGGRGARNYRLYWQAFHANDNVVAGGSNQVIDITDTNFSATDPTREPTLMGIRGSWGVTFSGLTSTPSAPYRNFVQAHAAIVFAPAGSITTFLGAIQSEGCLWMDWGGEVREVGFWNQAAASASTPSSTVVAAWAAVNDHRNFQIKAKRRFRLATDRLYFVVSTKTGAQSAQIPYQIRTLWRQS